MGLLTGLLTLPLAPVRGVVWIAEQVQTQAERECDDRAAIQRRLTEIAEARDAGELSAEQAAELEDQVLEDLLRRNGKDL